MQITIFEPSEAIPCIEGHGIQVDRMHHHDFEPDMAGSLRHLAQRMRQQPRADTAAMEARIDRQTCQQHCGNRKPSLADAACRS